jgi:hypothetical protein
MIFLSVCAIGLCGAGLSNAGLPGASRALRVAVAIALGIGVWSSAYAAQWLAFGARGTLWKDVVLALAGIALLLYARSGVSARLPRRTVLAADHPAGESLRAPRWLVVLLGCACALCIAAFVEHTVRLPDGGWDAWMTWNLRARFLVRAADAREAFSPQMLFWSHQEYPWLLPGVVAQVFLLCGESYAAPAVVAFVFGALLLAVLVASLSALEGRRTALLGGLALCSLPCFSTFTANQQADVPLALYVTISAALLELEGGERRTAVLSGVAAGLAAWTKHEGALYLACFAAGLLLFRRRALLPYLAGALPGIVLFAAFKLTVAPHSAFAEAGAAARILDPRRWVELFLLVVRRVVFFQAYALWVVAWIAALWVARDELRRSWLAAALLFAFAACAAIYLLVPFPLGWIFRTSADRLFMQLWPSALLLTLPALRRATAHT